MVVLDPGHQLGNHNFPRKISRLVPAGGFRKPCNTTGTATRGGYPEATFAWRVATLAARPARAARRARCVLTRHSNRQDRWGPCVDERGRAGNRVGADLKLSIHADGSAPPRRPRLPRHRAHRPPAVDRTTSPPVAAAGADRPGRRCARPGCPVANYTAGGDGLDFRCDLGTLNLSDVPTVMVELGNMRNARDARRMTTAAAGRRTPGPCAQRRTRLSSGEHAWALATPRG